MNGLIGNGGGIKKSNRLGPRRDIGNAYVNIHQASPRYRVGQKAWGIKFMDKVPNFKKFIRPKPSQTEIIERMSNIQEEKSLTYRKVANWRIDDRIRNELPSEVRVVPKGGG